MSGGDGYRDSMSAWIERLEVLESERYARKAEVEREGLLARRTVMQRASRLPQSPAQSGLFYISVLVAFCAFALLVRPHNTTDTHTVLLEVMAIFAALAVLPRVYAAHRARRSQEALDAIAGRLAELDAPRRPRIAPGDLEAVHTRIAELEEELQDSAVEGEELVDAGLEQRSRR